MSAKHIIKRKTTTPHKYVFPTLKVGESEFIKKQGNGSQSNQACVLYNSMKRYIKVHEGQKFTIKQTGLDVRGEGCIVTRIL